MKVLVVCSYNNGKISPFIREQVFSLKKEGIKIDYFKIRGKGIIGYLKNYPSFLKKLFKSECDFVHAHYGFCGLLSILQPFKSVVCTFHGSDVHNYYERILSKLVSRICKFTILTNSDQIDKLNLSKNFSVIKCGIDLNTFKPMDKDDCRKKIGLKKNTKYALFSSSFDNPVKDYRLAKESIEKASEIVKYKIELLELKGFTKVEVAMLINAVDFVLVTSKKETGPLIVKEALACNTNVVSTNVGDVHELIKDEDGSYIVESNPTKVSEGIVNVLSDINSTIYDYRSQVEKYGLPIIAKRIKRVYDSI